jgi:hypothetical protein
VSVLAPTANPTFDLIALQATAAQQQAYASLQAPAAAAAWSSGTSYPIGAFVAVGGVIYKSLVANNEDNNPTSSNGAWMEMSYPNIQAAMQAVDVQFYATLLAAAQDAGLTYLAVAFQLSIATITNSQPWNLVPN